MSAMKQAMIENGDFDEREYDAWKERVEDDGFITVDMHAPFDPIKHAHTAVAEFCSYICAKETELSRDELRKLVNVAIDVMDAAPHGLDCNRGYDDHPCTCWMGPITDELYAAQEDLQPCKTCQDDGLVWVHYNDPQDDIEVPCPDCKGQGGTLSNGVQFCNCD